MGDALDYPSYLDAKESVDARARNPRVWASFVQRLTAEEGGPVAILDLGCGTGSLSEKVLETVVRRESGADVALTLVDNHRPNIKSARDRLADWAAAHASDVQVAPGRIVASTGTQTLRIHLEHADLFDALAARDRESMSAVVAQAVLDIVPMHDALRAVNRVLRPGAPAYLPIHFDGVSAFAPATDPQLDAAIERLYHESMTADDGRVDAGGAHTGRRLLTAVREAGMDLLDAGSSDWVVFADPSGTYPDDEAAFLNYILDFFEAELTGHADLDPDRFAQWIARRRRQVDAGTLSYVAHQLDVLGGGA